MRTEMLTLTAVAAMAALTSISDAKIAHAGQSLEMSLSRLVAGFACRERNRRISYKSMRCSTRRTWRRRRTASASGRRGAAACRAGGGNDGAAVDGGQPGGEGEERGAAGMPGGHP